MSTLRLKLSATNVIVSDATKAEKYLRQSKTSARGVPIAGLLSFCCTTKRTHRQQPSSIALRSAARWLCLVFDDVRGEGRDHPDEIPHTDQDIEKILKFGKMFPHFGHLGAEPLGSRVLIHCYAGQSRSTAAALMLFAQACPADDEVLRLFTASLEDPAGANPNPIMIADADRILGTGDRIQWLRRLFMASRI